MLEYIEKILGDYNLTDAWVEFFSYMAVLFIILVICALAYLFTKMVLFRAIKIYAKLSKNKWDDVLFEKGFFDRLAKLAPAIIIHMFAPAFPHFQTWIQRLAFSYIILVSILALSPFLDSIDTIYRTYEISKEKPIKGLLQVIKIVVFILGGITVIAILIDKSPWILLSGIGVFSAVLLLIFQNSILGFVAGIQLASNDMVRVGDWIEMPKYNADGDVVDITLHTVKVQNWDKTITMIPTHAMISDSFKNWRGMKETGGRRIKRSVYIDMNSIKFCTEEMLERFEKIHYITEYIRIKKKDIEQYNRENNIDPSELVNGRRMTNIGTFRAYIHEYLKHHPKLHHRMIMTVRQLESTPSGLPIEIYCFTNDTAWVNYEAVQSDIFDHIFAIVNQFDLQIYQNPTGQDFKTRFYIQ